ncbi:MAG: DUF2171 domain-containing protein [Sphingomonas sp.]
MDDRNRPYGPRDSFDGRSPGGDYTQDYGSGRDYTYSSARDYAAAGELGSGRSRAPHGGRDYRDEWSRNRSDYRSAGPRAGYGSDRQRSDGGPDRDRGYDQDRGFFERAGDEVRSWFGDEEAERRRERDQRYDEALARNDRRGHPDEHYTAWRRSRIAELDRDYDEYRRENAQRFENEFNSWRTERTGQRDGLRRVAEHMEVLGSDGAHVGTVDKVRGDRILLTKSDSDAGGHHHSIPSRWIASVDDKVTLRKTADEAHAHWKDEERAGALFGSERDDQSWRTDHNLNRSFSGTY